MSHTTNDDDVVDYGTAPVVYVNGLARVDQMGSDALFALWAWRITMSEGRITRTREVVQNVVIPVAAIGPAVELTLATFGLAVMHPGATDFLRRLIA